MESTRDIKGRIKSVTNIQQITKAMKMVAAARLRKAEEKANGSRPYAEKIGELLRRASSVTPGFTSPLFRTGEVKKVGYLVICGDKGLAGAYNSNVMKRTLQEISGKDRSAYALYVCGKQAKNYLKFRGYDPDTYHFGFSDKPSAQDSIDLSKEMVEYFTKEEVDEVYIIYTKMINAFKMEADMFQLLPLQREEYTQKNLKGYSERMTFHPSVESVLNSLIPNVVCGFVYGALVESYASEHNSRMMAMQTATDSAKQMLHDLEIEYNRVRQAAITQEITEIVAGAEEP